MVLRDPGLAAETAEALTEVGYEAMAMTSSMGALRALEAANTIELLIASADFPDSQPNGLALARMTRLRRPQLRVIFTNGPEKRPHVEKDGVFIPTPTTPNAIVEVAERLMRTAA